MAKARFASVDEYLAAQPEAARAALVRVRGALRRALPGAEETISYQIPTYKLGGRAVIYFAGWKQHYAVYPVSEDIAAALGAALAPYEVAKGTVRFPLGGRVPERLIARFARLRAKKLGAGGSSAPVEAARPVKARPVKARPGKARRRGRVVRRG
jgi:uncharacterized protein YdhG (YjbR/CyaY superfamily)